MMARVSLEQGAVPLIRESKFLKFSKSIHGESRCSAQLWYANPVYSDTLTWSNKVPQKMPHVGMLERKWQLYVKS